MSSPPPDSPLTTKQSGSPSVQGISNLAPTTPIPGYTFSDTDPFPGNSNIAPDEMTRPFSSVNLVPNNNSLPAPPANQNFTFSDTANLRDLYGNIHGMGLPIMDDYADITTKKEDMEASTDADFDKYIIDFLTGGRGAGDNHDNDITASATQR